MTSSIKPWLEKYRASNLEEIVGQNEYIEKFKIYVETQKMPNLIFCGPSGVGKTSSALCLANNINKGYINQTVLVINTSEEKKMRLVDTIIKGFIDKLVSIPEDMFKIIILDECENLSKIIQSVLKDLLEDSYNSKVRFIFLCNDYSKIIESIKSKCNMFIFNTLSEEDIILRLLTIIKNEEIPFTEEGLVYLVKSAEGDMRKALNTLYFTYYCFKMINYDNVNKIVFQPKSIIVRNIFSKILNNNPKEANSILFKTINNGYNTLDIIYSMIKILENYNFNNDMNLSYENKSEWSKLIYETHSNIISGSNGLIQLSALIYNLHSKMDFKK